MDKKMKVVLDTDTFNEIDDQFALAYMVLSKDIFDVQAIYAAPFLNNKSTSPKDGMEKSYNEILTLLDLMGEEDLKKVVYKGSDKYLENESTPVESEAARNLVERALAMPEGERLQVIAIGAITNVASAFIMEPSIANKVKVVWLGGNAHYTRSAHEFNMAQDIAGARVLFDSGAEIVQLPCGGCVDRLTTTKYELLHFLKGKNALCDYLCDYTIKTAAEESQYKTWSRVIWDISTIAYYKKGLYASEFVPAPIPTYEYGYDFDDSRNTIECVTWVNRDAILEDLFITLTGEELEA